MLYFSLPYGNICSLIRLFYKIAYIFMFRKIVRRCAFPRILVTKDLICSLNLKWGSKITLSIQSIQRIISRDSLELFIVMGARLCQLRGEQSDAGFLSKNGQTSLLCPLLNIWWVGRKDLNYLTNFGIGTGNSEVISIEAGEKIVGLGECGDKEVE